PQNHWGRPSTTKITSRQNLASTSAFVQTLKASCFILMETLSIIKGNHWFGDLFGVHQYISTSRIKE
ncbi:MAG TPA: hypothetical protein PLD61_01425, partial [Bacillota bacterium]|nr:hypothetical protein [Bacillota bacterium]